MTNARAIVLDFNGTLAQDDHLVAPIYVETFASIGASLSPEDYHRELAAMPDREVFELAMRRVGLAPDHKRRDALIAARVAGYLAAVDRSPPIEEHAAEFVREAAARVPLAIASGAFRSEIDHVLLAAGLAEHFPVLVAIEDVTNGKPDPEAFLRALAGLNALRTGGPMIAPEQAVAIEDATDGARAAHAAGMRVAAIRGLAYDESSGLADFVIERLDRSALEPIMSLPQLDE
jgi:HAD superfamily hydrolase (TIGR01509 family)